MTETTAAIFAALPANLQYVWGLRNVNDLVLRDSNNGAGGNLGISGSGLGLRLYALQDANWNVVALVNASGAVQERFSYTAYGTATALNPEFHGLQRARISIGRRSLPGSTWTPPPGSITTTPAGTIQALACSSRRTPRSADPNTYRYAGNNPVTMTDPSGEMWATDWEWDPGVNDWRDMFSGMSYSGFQLWGAARLAAPIDALDNQEWLQWYNRHQKNCR